eukprot:SAG11_NODE_1033_length_6095_cov_5.337725_4_plen_80_part_00
MSISSLLGVQVSRKKLPIFAYRDDLLSAIDEYQVRCCKTKLRYASSRRACSFVDRGGGGHARIDVDGSGLLPASHRGRC